MAFLDDFREAAVPRLREVAKREAFCVALDIIDLEEARAIVAAEARTAGSALLRPADQDRLSNWIAEVVWAEADAALDRVAALQAKAEAADPVRLYEGLAIRCSDPERMRWVFASFCAPYRKHLIEERRRARKA